MAVRVSIVSAGSPFTRVTAGPPATPVADGTGIPISLVSSGGAPPIALINDDGTQYAGAGVDALLLENGGLLLQETGDTILLEY